MAVSSGNVFPALSVDEIQVVAGAAAIAVGAALIYYAWHRNYGW